MAADWVVNSAGRIADVDALGLAARQVDHDNGGIAIHSYLRSTSNSRVYICGYGVPTSPQLSPIATYEGDLVGRNIVDGPTHSPDYANIATTVYTVPALAAVGLTEVAAKAKGLSAEIHVNDMDDWFLAPTYAEAVAWSKIIVDRGSDHILGVILSATPVTSLQTFSALP